MAYRQVRKDPASSDGNGAGAEDPAAPASHARGPVDDHALARDLCTAGLARIAAREYAAAEDVLRAALRHAGVQGEPGFQAEIHRGLLQCAFFTGDRPGALAHGIQALHHCEHGGDARRTAIAHNDLGLVYGAMADYESALRHLLEGLKILRGLGDQKLGSALNNIGNVYLELGDPSEALNFFRSARDAFRACEPGRGEAIALGNIGRALAALDEHAAACDAFEQSLHAYEEQGAAAYVAPAVARLADARASLGDVAAARDCFARALAALEGDSGGEFADEVLLAAGRFLLAQGEPDRAVELLDRALALPPSAHSTPHAADLHGALADAHEIRGDPAAALLHFREFHRIRQAVANAAVTVRIRGMMLQFDVERARQQEEIYRLKNVELAEANEELHRLHEELESRNRDLQQISVEDALTGLHNRRFLDAQLEHEVARSLRRRRPLSVAICDLDHFKQVNDQFSHGVGDDVLRTMGHIFRTTVRREDVVARYGGEEFVVICPETDLEGARVLVERLRAAVAAHPWHLLHPELRVTLSIGLGTLGAVTTADALLAVADARLYEAKRSGRDRVCV